MISCLADSDQDEKMIAAFALWTIASEYFQVFYSRILINYLNFIGVMFSLNIGLLMTKKAIDIIRNYSIHTNLMLFIDM